MTDDYCVKIQFGEHDIEKALAGVTDAPPELKKQLPDFYRLGRLSVDVVGFRCVGFNYELDAELRRVCAPKRSKSTKRAKRKVKSPSPEKSGQWDHLTSSDFEEAEPVRKRAKKST